MQQVCQGQTQQLGLLFERYHIRLYNFYRRTVNDEELCEDLVQTVFERILKYKHTYKPEAAFKSWFYSIARNVKADHFKKQKYLTDPLDPIQTERNLQLSTEDRSLEHEEQIQTLYEAINRLPEDKREILVLSQLEEMEYKELSAVFGITENAARVKVHRALKSLKEIFHKKY
ncbi:RNA polymerase sigma factor [Eisenibacter elegans]|jgi:RNA polymerase sigma-70 factor (ECF subfamily)|uniref:RNA polymerase sigma factor n=1 Tax=Eisenibacter elegans TaxID=997 RepID=UPI0004010521|nr:RNA polymerase sigma factor [Eisenibacter elegans]